jgi:hypothetical protein
MGLSWLTCLQGALKRAVIQVKQNGKPQLISVAPEEVLSQKKVYQQGMRLSTPD